MLPDAGLQGKRTGWRRGVGIKGFTDICNHLHPGGRGTERLEKWSCHYANGSRHLKVTSHLPVRWHFEMLQFSILTLRDMICRHHMNHQEPSRDKHKKPVIPGEHILCRIHSAGCNGFVLTGRNRTVTRDKHASLWRLRVTPIPIPKGEQVL